MAFFRERAAFDLGEKRYRSTDLAGTEDLIEKRERNLVFGVGFLSLLELALLLCRGRVCFGGMHVPRSEKVVRAGSTSFNNFFMKEIVYNRNL